MKQLLLVLLFAGQQLCAQSDEAKQLLLNVEKLAQFKQILQNMKDGYQVLQKGYTSIRDISAGNFNLHKTFLDGLMAVSPTVKKYKRVADIISYQVRLVKEFKAAFRQFKEDRQFTVTEIHYIGNVYAHLFRESLKKLDELSMVITAGQLRMSDDERLQIIDRIYGEVVEQYTFLNEFNNSTAILSLQREKDQQDINLMKRIHGLQ